MKQEIEDNFAAMQDEITALHNRVDDAKTAARKHLGGMAFALTGVVMLAIFRGPSSADLRKVEAEIAVQPTWICEHVQQGEETQIQNWIVKEERCDTFYRTRRFNETVRHFNEVGDK